MTMPGWLDTWLRKKPKPVEDQTERRLALERDLQSLRLELAERDRQLATSREDLERERNRSTTRITEAMQAQIERVLTDVAAPVSQLLTQTYLLEVENQPVQAKGVLITAKQLVRVLEEYGLALRGEVGQVVPYDPNYHQPLSDKVALVPGEPVVIKFSGMSYAGRMIRKAGVVKQ
jgi:molecular chaperone GrpE (heat shock protein)